MLFVFGPRSSLLLPFVVPGAVATLWLLGRAWRRGSPADALLALLVALPTLSVTQWMLGYAGWYDSHDGHSTAMFYVPWNLGLALGPAYYLYFRSLTNQAFRWRPLGWHLLPGLLEIGLFAAVAVYDLLWWHRVQGRPLPDHFGTKGPAATALDGWSALLTVPGHVLLLAYGVRMLLDYRRYRRYLDDNFSDPERLRFAGLRQLLVVQLLALALALSLAALDAAFGPFSYDAAWNAYVLRGFLIYGLVAVGLQANYAAASSPLRFEPGAPDADSDAPQATSGASEGSSAATDSVPIAAEGVPIAAGGVPIAAGGVPIAAGGVPIAAEGVPIAAGGVPIAAGGVPIAAGGVPIAARGVPIAARGVAGVAELPAELHPWRARLLALMADERPWLEPELTLTELGQRLRLHPALLSKVINAGCGQNFNDFVNTHRVAEARRKLADPRFAHYSLVGVALESGFNSKSTFNRVFRKLAGQAPGEVARPKS